MTEITMDDLLKQENKRDPHSFYEKLRTTEPISYVPGLDSWVITTYEDTLQLLKDPRFIKDGRKLLASSAQEEQVAEQVAEHGMHLLAPTLLMVDPPDHTRMRSLVSKAFTPRMIEQMRPRVQQIADNLLDALPEHGEMDFILAFAYPLPITVICEMLGIPVEDRASFRVWTQAIINPDQGARMAALQEFIAYIRSLLRTKSAHPGNDLLSELVKVEENGDQLSEDELVSLTFLLIVAGHETTVNLLGNGTLALLQYPEQLQLLRADPSLIPSAVEELLRYTSPVSLSDERWAGEDIMFHGKLIKKGQMIVSALVSANSDPQRFPGGNELDLTRRENQHLAFGKGIHHCLGAPLARLEGQVAFGTLLRRLPDLRLTVETDELVWNHNFMLRGLSRLPLAF